MVLGRAWDQLSTVEHPWALQGMGANYHWDNLMECLSTLLCSPSTQHTPCLVTHSAAGHS